MRTFALLLLILWLSRIPALDALPLHNDEGLHLTRAVEVWNLHPFWEIRDGKIINQWAIALFYPQNAPVFAGRIATIFVSLIGFAGGYALIRRTLRRRTRRCWQARCGSPRRTCSSSSGWPSATPKRARWSCWRCGQAGVWRNAERFAARCSRAWRWRWRRCSNSPPRPSPSASR